MYVAQLAKEYKMWYVPTSFGKQLGAIHLNEVEQFLAYARRLLEADPTLCPCPDPRSAGAMIAFLSGLAAAWEVDKLRAAGETETVRQAMRDGFAQGVRDGILGMGASNGAD